MDGPSDILQMTDFLTHCLALDAHTSSREQDEQTFNADAGKTKETNERPR